MTACEKLGKQGNCCRLVWLTHVQTLGKTSARNVLSKRFVSVHARHNHWKRSIHESAIQSRKETEAMLDLQAMQYMQDLLLTMILIPVLIVVVTAMFYWVVEYHHA